MKKCKIFKENCYNHPECLKTLVDKYGDAHGYEGPQMEDIDSLVRDLTKVGSIPKSEARRRISDLLEAYRNLDIPPGVSQWRNQGEKWSYDKFFTVIKDEKLTRLEIINHSKNKHNPFGRCFTHWDDKTKIELSLQDDEKTLKIFLDDR